MKAYEITPGTSVDAIAMVERPMPVPGPGDIAIDVRACALNYRDILTVCGTYAGGDKATGIVPLSDGAGVVAAVGAGVTRFRVGDRVAGAFMPQWQDGPLTAALQAGALGGKVDGMLAERVVLPAAGAVASPGTSALSRPRRCLVQASRHGTRCSSAARSNPVIPCCCWVPAACRSLRCSLPSWRARA